MESLKRCFSSKVAPVVLYRDELTKYKDELTKDIVKLHNHGLSNEQKYNALNKMARAVYRIGMLFMDEEKEKVLSSIDSMLILCVEVHKDMIKALGAVPDIEVYIPVDYENGPGSLPTYNDLARDLELLNDDRNHSNLSNDAFQKFLFLNKVNRRIHHIACLLQQHNEVIKGETGCLLRLYSKAYQATLRILMDPEKCIFSFSSDNSRTISSRAYVENQVNHENLSMSWVSISEKSEE